MSKRFERYLEMRRSLREAFKKDNMKSEMVFRTELAKRVLARELTLEQAQKQLSAYLQEHKDIKS